MRRFALPTLLAASALILGTSASALTITLSEMSSEANPPASDLDATLVFTDNGDGTFDLTVTNSSTFDINLIAFNFTSAAGTLTLDSFDGTACSGSPGCGWNLTTSQHVAGFGSFDFQVQDGVGPDPSQIDNGETKTFVFSFTGSAIAFETNAKGLIAAAKFVEGENDASAFGASGTGTVVPEPASAWLLGLSLAGLAVAARTRA